MISDTLFEAIADIRRYLDWEPCPYVAERPHIEALLAHMESIQHWLDQPPPMIDYSADIAFLDRRAEALSGKVAREGIEQMEMLFLADRMQRGLPVTYNPFEDEE